MSFSEWAFKFLTYEQNNIYKKKMFVLINLIKVYNLTFYDDVYYLFFFTCVVNLKHNTMEIFRKKKRSQQSVKSGLQPK